VGTNRRYGSPSERAEIRRRREAMITPDGCKRIRHCWVKVNLADAFDDPEAPGVIVEWAHGRNNDLWYARVVHVPDGHTVVDAWFPYTQLTPVDSR
jgi:hypothetical protein